MPGLDRHRAAGSTSTRPAAPSPAMTTSRSPSAATIPTCPPTAESGRAGPRRPSPSASRSSRSTASRPIGATGPESRPPGRLRPGSSPNPASNAPSSTPRSATASSKASSSNSQAELLPCDDFHAGVTVLSELRVCSIAITRHYSQRPAPPSRGEAASSDHSLRSASCSCPILPSRRRPKVPSRRHALAAIGVKA